MIALHADKIIAGKYSLVGSIGAIMEPWQLDRAIAKIDISQRIYASGKLKAFLNPFTPVTPEVDAKAQRLVDQFGKAFLEEVKALRGARLKPGIDVASGEVWPASEAKALGLIDAIGTIDDYVGTNYGLKTYDFGPSAPGLSLLGRTFQDAIVGSVERLASPLPPVH
jgi:protease-4